MGEASEGSHATAEQNGYLLGSLGLSQAASHTQEDNIKMSQRATSSTWEAEAGGKVALDNTSSMSAWGT